MRERRGRRPCFNVNVSGNTLSIIIKWRTEIRASAQDAEGWPSWPEEYASFVHCTYRGGNHCIWVSYVNDSRDASGANDAPRKRHIRHVSRVRDIICILYEKHDTLQYIATIAGMLGFAVGTSAPSYWRSCS